MGGSRKRKTAVKVQSATGLRLTGQEEEEGTVESDYLQFLERHRDLLSNNPNENGIGVMAINPNQGQMIIQTKNLSNQFTINNYFIQQADPKLPHHPAPLERTVKTAVGGSRKASTKVI